MLSYDLPSPLLWFDLAVNLHVTLLSKNSTFPKSHCTNSYKITPHKTVRFSHEIRLDLFILKFKKNPFREKETSKIHLWELIHHDADWRQFCFTRWLSACLGMRRSWSLTPLSPGSLKTSYTASAAPTASERPCCSRSSSSTLAGSSPTTQSCSVACWRSVWGTLSPLLWVS